MTQTDLASRVFREDGAPISKQYIFDIESGRATPSAEQMLAQFSAALEVDLDYLCYLAGCFPSDIRGLNLTEEELAKAMSLIRNSRQASKKKLT